MAQTRYAEGDGSTARARRLRRDSTPAERRLWSLLRAGALDGLKFRRQQRLGPFFGDFVCRSVRLVVEVDGETHSGAEAQQKDAARTAFLKREGYRVIRFTNGDVMKDPEGVAAAIRQVLGVTDPPSPSHAAAPRGPLPLPHGQSSE